MMMRGSTFAGATRREFLTKTAAGAAALMPSALAAY